MNKVYPVNQSPFYCLRSKNKLTKLLKVDTYAVLESLTKDSFYSSVKDNGKTFTPPRSKLRVVHDRIHKLLAKIETPEYLHSGVKGRSNISNALSHNSSHGMIKTDIKNFFPSTPKIKIKRFFQHQMKCNHLIAEILSEILTYKGYLPKGSPCSTSLSFWVNKGMFDKISSVCKESDAKLTVYVDDITISMPHLNRNVLRRTNGIIKKNGYEHHKELIYKPSQPKVVTGIVIQANSTFAVNKVHKKLIGASDDNPSTRSLRAYTKLVRT